MIPSVQNGKKLFIYTVFNRFKHVLLLSSSIIFLFFPLIIQNLQKYNLMMQGKMTTLHGFSKNLLWPGYVNSCNDALPKWFSVVFLNFWKLFDHEKVAQPEMKTTFLLRVPSLIIDLHDISHYLSIDTISLSQDISTSC